MRKRSEQRLANHVRGVAARPGDVHVLDSPTILGCRSSIGQLRWQDGTCWHNAVRRHRQPSPPKLVGRGMVGWVDGFDLEYGHESPMLGCVVVIGLGPDVGDQIADA